MMAKPMKTSIAVTNDQGFNKAIIPWYTNTASVKLPFWGVFTFILVVFILGRFS